jgi:ABC-type Mn2+/Zn2+ transport system ATPase subunit
MFGVYLVLFVAKFLLTLAFSTVFIWLGQAQSLEVVVLYGALVLVKEIVSNWFFVYEQKVEAKFQTWHDKEYHKCLDEVRLSHFDQRNEQEENRIVAEGRSALFSLCRSAVWLMDSLSDALGSGVPLLFADPYVWITVYILNGLFFCMRVYPHTKETATAKNEMRKINDSLYSELGFEQTMNGVRRQHGQPGVTKVFDIRAEIDQNEIDFKRKWLWKNTITYTGSDLLFCAVLGYVVRVRPDLFFVVYQGWSSVNRLFNTINWIFRNEMDNWQKYQEAQRLFKTLKEKCRTYHQMPVPEKFTWHIKKIRYNARPINIPPFILSNNTYVSVVGKSGYGKTTVMKILLGYVEADLHSTMNGTFVSNAACLSDMTTYVTTEFSPFTVHREIRRSWKEYVCDQHPFHADLFWDTLRTVELVTKHDGLVTDPDAKEVGTTLSAGEKVRVELARKLYDHVMSQRRMLFIDEPDKGLGQEMALSILRNLRKFCDGCIVVISHAAIKDQTIPFTHVIRFVKRGVATVEVRKH